MHETIAETTVRVLCLTYEKLSHALTLDKPCNLHGFSSLSHSPTHRG
jgi:hypothetical protein